MKYFTFVLLAVLIIGVAAPAAQVSARSNDDESHHDDSRGDYDDRNDNEYEDSDRSDLTDTALSTSTSANVDDRIKLLQELLTRLIALLTELKGGSPVVTPITPVTPVATSTILTYTAAAVATHNTVSSCWSIINSNVYNLTDYMSLHPGGSQNIMGICGKDGTAAFTGQHGGSSRPESILSGYYLAPLAQ